MSAASTETTAADIAARAGVTERTFFRHFTDQREVVFNAEVSLREAMARALAEVPSTGAPWAAVPEAFRSMSPDLERDRPAAQVRHRVIAATPALRERELANAAAMSVVVADALTARGLPERRAALRAQVSTAALGHAIRIWLADPSSDVDALIVQAFTDLRDLCDVEITAAPVARSHEE